MAPDQVSILRTFDHKEDGLVAIFRTEGAADLIGFLDDPGEPWCPECWERASVLIDTSDVVQIDDPDVLRRIGGWFIGAAHMLEHAAQDEGWEDVE